MTSNSKVVPLVAVVVDVECAIFNVLRTTNEVRRRIDSIYELFAVAHEQISPTNQKIVITITTIRFNDSIKSSTR
jgi:hypothetical protein